MKISKAQIVATVGPASSDKEVLKSMVLHHMDIARLNFSWGTFEEREQQIKTIKDVSNEVGRHISILVDLPGPRIQASKDHTYDSQVEEVLTDKDKESIEFGINQGVDYFAMSFVGNAKDVTNCKNVIEKFGGKQKIIAKIEREVAVQAADEIIAAADGIMVARGDLGNEIPLEKIPFVQREIIQKCKKVGKPVITATQMMLTMVDNPTPTRAEVTDVASAILWGSDAVMLSEESARGKYPVEAVAMMEKIIIEAEHFITKSFSVNSL